MARAAAGLNSRDLTLVTEVDGFEVYADPMLEKAFYNLFGDAVLYAGPAPTVGVHCQRRERSLVIVVEDDGPGIPAGEKEKIFIRGFGKNTGLGLFLVREILSTTGIAIRETGEPGKSARFEIVVPEGGWRVRGAATGV
ncbi:MAG: Multi-sensor signal transduction histidine kinase [Methanoculleus marisnigri]|uniref:histidine kinase n=1 Tax=Methanoculleus marisnigri TaxID=2198 RepID=A0A101GRT9_9EURY|nr:HAMP domain-containing sensor histidine kinase [Methanoculleus marisnigri]KUK63075.1 MAG: Multi-sensor signal transduction histidine kinase [Methanoculleus marisnigri]KUL02148.1 MAG: Multi-sensor signal transduction histidine kinase [Methanoculleus marisnigri]